MPLTVGTKDVMLNDLDVLAPFVAIHSAWPGETGLNEASTTRQAVTYNVSAGASKSISNAPLVPMPGGATAAFAGFWSLAVGGIFRGWSARAGNVPAPFELDDTTEPDLFRCNNHGLVEDQTVFLMDTSGAVLPGTFVEGTIYFVDLTGLTDPTDTFKLAATAGGAPIAAGTDGAGFVQSIITQLYATAGVEDVSSAVFDLLR